MDSKVESSKAETKAETTPRKMPTTHIEFLKWQVIQYNRIVKVDKEGYNCTACKNRRFFARINSDGEFALRPCTCTNIIASQRAVNSNSKR